MAYLGMSWDLTEVSSPGDAENCARYCAWLAAKKAGSLTMDYMERPPGCTCSDEVKGTKYTTELPMTPQQIEAAVKREQSAATGGGLALAAIAALLLLG